MKILDPEDYEQLFEIDSIHYDSELEQFVNEVDPSLIYIFGNDVNPYSKRSPLAPEFDWFSRFNINTSSLFNIINECRIRKTSDEIELMRNAAKVGCDAHMFVMKKIKPGMNEVHVQTLFRVFDLFDLFYSS